MKKYLLLLLSAGLFFTSCKNDDDIFPDDNGDETQKTANDYPVQNFMYQVMNSFYFWQEDVPNLADSKFKSLDDPDYISFLASEEDPGRFFYYELCKNHVDAVGNASAQDRFSRAFENYKDLVNSLQGISSSNGVEFQLYLAKNDVDVYGVVTYILPNSDAFNKDITRGDIFNGVNGQTLNVSNYLDLLFSNNTSYTLNMADLSGDSIIGNGKEVALNKIENFSENPIHIKKIIEQNGKKIGYLMYNSFLAAYDDELNDVFGEFKSENIDELILDFRYNGGGRVTSAIQLASAVYGTETDKLFLRARYNDKIMSAVETSSVENYFTNETFDSKTPLNTLNLKKVYIIATDRTASASELVMNGLAPYIDVIHVGELTVGKSEFSDTFVDDPLTNYLYTGNNDGSINPDNQWGIQPLLGKNENADGFSGYEGGLVPDYELPEDISNLGVLGEIDEPLLAFTLSIISGNTAKKNFASTSSKSPFAHSKIFSATTNAMVMNGLLNR
ncbi:S41 family peptidase [Zobellia galactanivorans]|uniref:S41 family peptidase n=1 Tax=Zobellia galactanivorans (strain DSM 12802 / CCUG 47099 / CIP 106680 / NCIMB 13871 / Dsij) TaxID=63186 RepID=UPI0026E3BADF|nr:S41 family peptidase [Zobellia galactanivorans]MDO6807918.1 S41 family peptidase [Zobellia galactanivorans]